ncbi:hypothetical protein [Lunatibacter salilacus]|nr:hypothetical protein [Lunatibacter salilacus]
MDQEDQVGRVLAAEMVEVPFPSHQNPNILISAIPSLDKLVIDTRFL